MFDFIKNIFKSKSKKSRVISDEEFNTLKKIKEDKVNNLLDKISKSGYSSLTKKEIDFLNKNG